MVDIDSETLFNGAAAVISTIAVLFFVLNVELGYSPVSKVALVVVFLAGIFALTQRTDDYQLTLLGYGVIVTSVVGVFFELMSTFNVGNTVTVAGLLVIAAVLFWVNRYLDERNHFVSGRQATYALGAVAVLVAGVLVVDVVTGGLSYELQPESEIEFEGEDTRHERELVVATVAVSNPTPLPERVEMPNYAVCTAGNWSAYRRQSEPSEPQREVEAHLYIQDGYNEHVMGYSTRTFPAHLNVNGVNLQGETFPVRQTEECPDEETGPPYIAIFETYELDRYGRPV